MILTFLVKNFEDYLGRGFSGVIYGKSDNSEFKIQILF
jgi:hypothetical protein